MLTFTQADRKIFFWVFLAVIFFVIGYFLRSYFDLIAPLAASPYEAFKSELDAFFRTKAVLTDVFSLKDASYPLAYLLQLIFQPLVGNFFLVYLLGGAAIFLLGKAFSGSAFGGVLSFLLYSVSAENLLQYVSTINPAGVSYVAWWFGLWSLWRYQQSGKDIYLLFFALSGIISISSYHTGGMIYIFFVVLFLAHHIFSAKILDRKYISASMLLLVFYGWWMIVVDFLQLGLVRVLILKPEPNLIFLGGISLGLGLLWPVAYFFKKVPAGFLEYLPPVALVIAGLLVFSRSTFFVGLLPWLGIPDYYISPVSLNNYLAQVLLSHIYLVALWPVIFSRDALFLRLWLAGLMIVAVALFWSSYYARLLDFTFPLGFVAFGVYWSAHKKFRKTVVAGTLILMVLSQIVIYRDSFSLRRYYTSDELAAAQNLTEELASRPGNFVSDLRTAALLDYVGQRGVKFDLFKKDTDFHQAFFYDYENLPSFIRGIKPKGDVYFILSQSMREILYSINFETTPLTDAQFIYYENNYDKVYDDGLLSVYHVYSSSE